jgi:hypothetical protein
MMDTKASAMAVDLNMVIVHLFHEFADSNRVGQCQWDKLLVEN